MPSLFLYYEGCRRGEGSHNSELIPSVTAVANQALAPSRAAAQCDAAVTPQDRSVQSGWQGKARCSHMDLDPRWGLGLSFGKGPAQLSWGDGSCYFQVVHFCFLSKSGLFL